METTLECLYDCLHTPLACPEEDKRVEANRQRLSKTLNRQQRKLVLRIIDDHNLICSKTSQDSFIQGFRLALQIAYELEHYGVCLKQQSCSDTRRSCWEGM